MISQGGGEGSGPPVPPSGSALGMQLVCTSKNIWAELSYEFGPSWHEPSFMWADLAWAELVLGRVVRNSYLFRNNVGSRTKPLDVATSNFVAE